MNTEIEKLHQREAEFHDEWANSEKIEDIDVMSLFEGLTAMENRFIIQHCGNLKGKKVLDVGAGLGESSVYFALQGAEVYYNDISPQMGEFANALAARYGVKIHTVIAPAEKIAFGEGFFDIVHCANLMHHVPKDEHLKWISNIHYFLKKGGWLYTWDPLKYNPVINVYRRMATEVRTDDEMPLGFDMIRTYGKVFTKVEHREFWFSTLWLFLYYYLIKRYNPNKVRYWKQIYKETPKTIGWWFKPLQSLDKFFLKLPLINRLAWNIVLCAQK
ncbi:MAG: class I SAM-dependent methyltransferase [Cytophagales bacterium]|nr:MAG: class I SAM-dependent methyltransferase [Cytophagales bacterium]TAF61670.1 MAG: class I SAM-dependent methyltransferase [Cytophagales bacterium]